MGNYEFVETVEKPNGEKYRFPLIVHELWNRPHNVIGVPEWASDKEIREAIESLEEKLGYELEKPNDFDEIRISDEEAKEFCPKRAGFLPNGEFIA